MKRIVYMDGDKLVVCIPVINTLPAPEDITEDEAIARAMEKLPATATDVRVLAESAIPASREFRALWVYNADKSAVIVEPVAQAAAIAEKTRLAEIDAASAGDGILGRFRNRSNADMNTEWTNLTAAEKDRALKRLVFNHVRKG